MKRRAARLHPRDTEGFEWDEANESELFPHHIMPWEAEQVYWNGPVWTKNHKRGTGDWKMIGLTDSGRALTLVVVVKQRMRMLRIITGWDCITGERTRYLRSHS